MAPYGFDLVGGILVTIVPTTFQTTN